jgi:uncharacterized repeat protein (TIGR03803 family)
MKHLFWAVCSISFLLHAGCPAEAATESVIYSFPHGGNPFGQPISDQSGRLYGTSVNGGRYGNGYVYELTNKRGAWSAKTILSFNGQNGATPVTGLTLDRKGTILYGSTESGGGAFGRIFSLRRGDTGWFDTALHDFSDGDGANPEYRLTRDRATGILYGTATNGGSVGCGTLYQLDPEGNFQLLHDFQNGLDGCGPEAQLRQGDRRGSFFGSTAGGGEFGVGTLFLLKEVSGVWETSAIHHFKPDGIDGVFPGDLSTLTSDGLVLYGLTSGGGPYNAGVVFQLKKSRNKWIYSIIYTFTGGSDGSRPVGLNVDNLTGVLYGTTADGGSSGNGVLFALTYSGKSWTETVVHSFGGSPDGANPFSRPYMNSRTGQLFGTTANGGIHNGGTVYVVTP